MATTIVVNTETTIVVTRILTPVNGFKIQQLSGTKENVIYTQSYREVVLNIQAILRGLSVGA